MPGAPRQRDRREQRQDAERRLHGEQRQQARAERDEDGDAGQREHLAQDVDERHLAEPQVDRQRHQQRRLHGDRDEPDAARQRAEHERVRVARGRARRCTASTTPMGVTISRSPRIVASSSVALGAARAQRELPRSDRGQAGVGDAADDAEQRDDRGVAREVRPRRGGAAAAPRSGCRGRTRSRSPRCASMPAAHGARARVLRARRAPVGRGGGRRLGSCGSLNVRTGRRGDSSWKPSDGDGRPRARRDARDPRIQREERRARPRGRDAELVPEPRLEVPQHLAIGHRARGLHGAALAGDGGGGGDRRARRAELLAQPAVARRHQRAARARSRPAPGRAAAASRSRGSRPASASARAPCAGAWSGCARTRSGDGVTARGSQSTR